MRGTSFDNIQGIHPAPLSITSLAVVHDQQKGNGQFELSGHQQ